MGARIFGPPAMIKTPWITYLGLLTFVVISPRVKAEHLILQSRELRFSFGEDLHG